MKGAGELRWFDAPWFDTLAPLLDELSPLVTAADWPGCRQQLNRLALERGVLNARSLPLSFIDPEDARDMAYESHIWQTGQVPTRSGEGAWHDFFNALIWLTFPRTKARLNALQAEAIARDGVGARRGGLRDAATLFDENAALVVGAPGPWLAAWQRHDWRSLFVEQRQAMPAQWRVLVFGHALLDKLRSPYKSACAHAWTLLVTDSPGLARTGAGADTLAPVPWTAQELAAIDQAAASRLNEQTLARGHFLPLPVLGVPGWWEANNEPSFYADPRVFRPLPAGNRQPESRSA